MAKLPADLPENWTSGQIISPNGTEVGLDAKHGYNYLMKQVNAAQAGVNTLNDNMTGVAQESTLQGVKTDVETLSTAAAKEATLQTVKTNVAQVQTDVTDLSQNFNDLTSIWQHTDTTVDTVLSRVGTTTDTNGSQTAGTVMGKLNAVQGQVGQFNFSDGYFTILDETVILDAPETHTASTGMLKIGQLVIPAGVGSSVRVRSKLKNSGSENAGMLCITNTTATPTFSNNIGRLDATSTTLEEYECFVPAKPGETLYFWIGNNSSSILQVTQADLVVSYAPTGDENHVIDAGTHTANSWTRIAQYAVPKGAFGKIRFKTNIKGGSLSYLSYFAITTTTTSPGSSDALLVGKVRIRTTTLSEVYIDADVVSGETLYFWIYTDAAYSSNAMTQTELVASYTNSKMVSARALNSPSVQEGFLRPSTPYGGQDSDVDNIYYHKIALAATVSNSNLVIFNPITSNALFNTFGFGRVVNGNELRLYQPNSSNSSFGGYWRVIDFGGTN